MVIPKKFKIVNRTYKVKPMSKEVVEGSKLLGDTCFKDALIRLDMDQPEECLEHTFLHELVHALLQVSTRPKLTHDEKLVDSIAGALHQYLQTKKGQLI